MTPLLDHVYAAEVAVLAQRVESVAATVSLRAGVLLTAGRTCPWDGVGAWTFRDSNEHTVARMRRCAARLDEAAAALRRHGVRVGAAVADLEERQARTAHRRVREIEHVLHHLGVGR